MMNVASEERDFRVWGKVVELVGESCKEVCWSREVSSVMTAEGVINREKGDKGSQTARR